MSPGSGRPLTRGAVLPLVLVLALCLSLLLAALLERSAMQQRLSGSRHAATVIETYARGLAIAHAAQFAQDWTEALAQGPEAGAVASLNDRLRCSPGHPDTDCETYDLTAPELPVGRATLLDAVDIYASVRGVEPLIAAAAQVLNADLPEGTAIPMVEMELLVMVHSTGARFQAIRLVRGIAAVPKVSDSGVGGDAALLWTAYGTYWREPIVEGLL